VLLIIIFNPTMADSKSNPDAFTHSAYSDTSNEADYQSLDPESGVKRGLKTRHLSMMALAGIIGPGLLVGSGGALSGGGPASLLIGFGVIGIIAFSIMQSLGELTTLYPTSGAFTSLADRFVDKAFGVAVGWNYWLIWAAVLANEYNAVSSIFVFWSDKVPLYGYFLIFWFFFLGFQLLGVEVSLTSIHGEATVFSGLSTQRIHANSSLQDLWRE
jgi:amino acid transporter